MCGSSAKQPECLIDDSIQDRQGCTRCIRDRFCEPGDLSFKLLLQLRHLQDLPDQVNQSGTNSLAARTEEGGDVVGDVVGAEFNIVADGKDLCLVLLILGILDKDRLGGNVALSLTCLEDICVAPLDAEDVLKCCRKRREPATK